MRKKLRHADYISTIISRSDVTLRPPAYPPDHSKIAKLKMDFVESIRESLPPASSTLFRSRMPLPTTCSFPMFENVRVFSLTKGTDFMLFVLLSRSDHTETVTLD